MAFHLHKPGQGYWVRVFTATIAAALVLATCAWLWPQIGQIKLPPSGWTAQVNQAQGPAPAPGTGVSLLMPGEEGAEPVEVGTAEVRQSVAVSPGRFEVRLGSVRFHEGRVSSQARSLRAGAPGGEGAFSGAVVAMTAVPLFETLYLQAGAVMVVILLGVWLIYWLVGVNPRSAEFLIATDGEMRKVNWSTRRDIVNSTYVVIGASVIIAAGLFMVDYVFATFFRVIGVLE